MSAIVASCAIGALVDLQVVGEARGAIFRAVVVLVVTAVVSAVAAVAAVAVEATLLISLLAGALFVTQLSAGVVHRLGTCGLIE